ncbi:MAG: glycosyltransferase family 4 protein [Leptolyngbyaceae cyanobacterium]
MDLQHLRLLLVQRAEPYRIGIQQGNLNTEQLVILEGLTTWGFQLQEVGVLGCTMDQSYDEILDAGVRVIGNDSSAPNGSVCKQLADFCPTHLVIDVPEPTLFRWAIRQHVHCIAMFRNTSIESGLKQKWDNYQLSKVLNHTGIDWVGGFGLDQCETLAQVGICRDKIIPWDWPPSNRAETFEPKQIQSYPDPLNLIYAGPLFSTRGIGDLLIAVAQLKAQGLDVRLKLVGEGDTQRFKTQAKRLQLDHIEFIEHVPEHSLVHLIRQADVFVMPSRHESPENSNTILNNCLQAHTPIIASDHPIFVGTLSHGVNALVFPAGNARALSHSIGYLVSHPDIYAKLSAATQSAWQSMQLPVHWISLLEQWLQGTTAAQNWLKQHTLPASIYQPQQQLQLLS